MVKRRGYSENSDSEYGLGKKGAKRPKTAVRMEMEDEDESYEEEESEKRVRTRSRAERAKA